MKSELAQKCQKIYGGAVAALGVDMVKDCVLDLCADNLDASLDDLMKAITEAGITNKYADVVFQD